VAEALIDVGLPHRVVRYGGERSIGQAVDEVAAVLLRRTARDHRRGDVAAIGEKALTDDPDVATETCTPCRS
jgi:hypothetical protein